MLKFRTLIIAACLAVSALAGAQSDPTKPIATVNGETIGGMEYFRRMEFLPGFGKMVGARFIESWPGYLALQQLINERLMLQIAKEKNVYPKDADVTAELDLRLKNTPTLLESLAKVGITKADLERQVRVDLAEFNITTMGVNVTDQEIEQHYKDNPTRFTVPKRYKLRLIAVSEDKKAQVDSALAGGKPFADVARDMSSDPSALQGGALGEIPATAFAEVVTKLLDATKIGSTTEWIKGTSGWFKFLLEDVKASEKIPLDANTKAQLRRSLMLDRGRVRNNLDKMMSDARKKANISVNQPGLNEMIQEWQKSASGD
ncbi:MAG: peptidyl-prolyl cis-trans isomerase [Fimbriimonadaceae bacterium]|nr:peptidyl-prolyl cis-trans isomerase [Fimbriimonadaceae bacterium]